MNKTSWIVVFAGLAAGAVFTAVAYDWPDGRAGMDHMPGKTVVGTQVYGEHKMGGYVTTVDHQTGMFGLQTSDGQLQLHFPPDSLSAVKERDEIIVQLGFTPLRSGLVIE